MAELRCYMVRYAVNGGESGVATVIDRTEDEARRTVVSHFDYHGAEVTIGKIRRVSLVEGGYVLMTDEQPQRQMTEAEWDKGALYGTLPYVNGYPDWSLLDDTDATRDEEGRTLRSRKAEAYYDILDRREG